MKSTPHFFVPQPRKTARMRLLCFPHCGGSATAFFSWGSQLGDEIECVGVQYPARGQRVNEAPLTSVAALAAEIAGRWDELSDLPFAFYGHSFGALVAFELARRLRRQRAAAPLLLCIGASLPPDAELPVPLIHALPDDAFIESIQSRYGGIPAAVAQERELLNLFMLPMRADFKAFEEYKPEPDGPLDAAIFAFAGEEDAAATPAVMQEWARYTQAGFELKIVPGGHFFVQQSLAKVIRTIRERLLSPISLQEIKGKNVVVC